MNCLYCEKEIINGTWNYSGFPFCYSHYFAIPMRLRRFLWQGQDAWQAALEWLENKYGKREAENVN